MLRLCPSKILSTLCALVIFAARLSTNSLGPLPADVSCSFPSSLFHSKRPVHFTDLYIDAALCYNMYCIATLLRCSSIQCD